MMITLIDYLLHAFGERRISQFETLTYHLPVQAWVQGPGFYFGVPERVDPVARRHTGAVLGPYTAAGVGGCGEDVAGWLRMLASCGSYSASYIGF